MIEAIELTSTGRSRGPGGAPVEKVSFDVYPGQVTALLGAPGAGKSAVLRMMVELEPGGGRTLFGGRRYRALRPAVREVGLALNPDALHPGRTVQAHLQLYSAAGGVPKGRIAEVLEIAGLSTQATARCGRLDPGQRQRLAIAGALLGDPSALILDEPRSLDVHGMSWFHALIRAYAAQGRTVLVAATDPDSLAGAADHVVILRRDDEDGVSRVIASRSAAEVFDERRATVIQVRSPQAARLAAALEAEGARLSPAGPGALEVRGLDRARIGEVAHSAGICLHELSEIGHDDNVFGLRPVPRQKELVASKDDTDAEDTALAATWTSGVRLVGPDAKAGENEVAVSAAERRGWAGVPGQPVSQGAGEADQALDESEDGSGARDADDRMSSGRESPAAATAITSSEAQLPTTLVAPSVRSAQPESADAAPEPSGPKRVANRAFATFRKGRKAAGEPVTVEATSAPAPPSQPAVPFTVVAAHSAAPVEAEGMTPWRAVATRAGQQQQQGSVVEAASAEQETSA